MLSSEQADHFAGDWIAAWNVHDLNRILSPHRDEVSFVSAFAVDHADGRDGVVRTRPALSRYFERAAGRVPRPALRADRRTPGRRLDRAALPLRSTVAGQSKSSSATRMGACRAPSSTTRDPATSQAG
jgi:hypothetical protein